LGSVRFTITATIPMPAPQSMGITVPSILLPNIFNATKLQIPEATQPIEPKTRICGNFSAGLWAIAMALVRPHVGI